MDVDKLPDQHTAGTNLLFILIVQHFEDVLSHVGYLVDTALVVQYLDQAAVNPDCLLADLPLVILSILKH